jgi:CRP-like cAMP-binding protein
MAEAADPRANRLLAAVPAQLWESVAAGVKVIQARRNQIIYRPGEVMERVTFPTSGLFSLVITDPLGSCTSIATVGREGAIELAPALGARFADCVQVSACHRLHPLEARMARCLLTTRDRIERDEFPCTHELLAGMLGASRPKVSLAMEALQETGAVRHRRGAIRICDPVALEAMTCGCYRTIRNAFASSH